MRNRRCSKEKLTVIEIHSGWGGAAFDLTLTVVTRTAAKAEEEKELMDMASLCADALWSRGAQGTSGS